MSLVLNVVDQEHRYSATDKKSFVLYQLRVTDPSSSSSSSSASSSSSHSFCVGRRYKQCFELHEWLLRHHPTIASSLPAFPPKLGGAALRLARLDGWFAALGSKLAFSPAVATRLREWVGAEGRPALLYRTASVCGICVIGEGRFNVFLKIVVCLKLIFFQDLCLLLLLKLSLAVTECISSVCVQYTDCRARCTARISSFSSACKHLHFQKHRVRLSTSKILVAE